MNTSFASIRRLCLLAVILAGMLFLPQSRAYAALTITPNTWNIIGLDSNLPTAGPYRFPVGAKVCSDVATTDVVADFFWDSANTYINSRPGSLTSVTIDAIAAGECADAYFEVEITQDAAAFDTTREYHITATDASGTVSTPTPRELYVEHLISQSRNSITSVKFWPESLGSNPAEADKTDVAAGGTMTLMVGNTYYIELGGATATQGYNQFEAFINFSNTIFQVLSVSTTYSANSNPTNVPVPNPALYADACIWDNDPNSPTYRSCIGGDDKAGGTAVTVYEIKILSGAGTTETLNTLLHDFSGSSYHYNADFGVGARFAAIVNAGIDKTFAPKTIAPGGTSTLTFSVSNPGSDALSGVNFSDSFPSGMTVAATPGAVNNCGGTFTATAGDSSVSLAGGSVAANSTCTITVDVTATTAQSYVNTTGNLFINTTEDTGDNGSDTLIVTADPTPPSACNSPTTIATWTMPTSGQGSGGPPPPYTFQETGVTATGSFVDGSGGGTQSIAAGATGQTNAWKITGGFDTGTTVPLASAADSFFDFTLTTTAYGGLRINFDADLEGNNDWGGTNAISIYLNAGSGFNAGTGYNVNKGAWRTAATIFGSATTYYPAAGTVTGATTTFRVGGYGVKSANRALGSVALDNVTVVGCPRPSAPTISKSFVSDPIAQGATSLLSFTITNPNTDGHANYDFTGITFTDVLPAGLDVADSSSSQCGGTLTTTAATRTITLTGGTLGQTAPANSCTFSVITVTGTTEGNYTNVSSNVSADYTTGGSPATATITNTSGGANVGYAQDTLTVISPPVLSKGYAPASVYTGNTTSLSYTITNPNMTSALSGIGFTDTLPAGVTVATSSSTQCGGTLTTTAPDTISFSGGSLAASSDCTFSLTATGASAGTWSSTTSAVTSTEGGSGNTASASLIVVNLTPAVDLTKQVSTTGTDPWLSFVGVTAGGDVYYRFKVYNSGDVNLTAISVSDPTLAGSAVDPATCTWTDPLIPGDTATCVKGPVAAASGSHPNTATASGDHALPSAGTVTSSPSTATYATAALAIDKSATETEFAATDDVLHYSYLVSNTGAAPLLGPVTVADDKSSDEACPSPSTVGDGDNYLDAGESITCTATYTVIWDDTVAGSVTNIATATAGGTTSSSDTVTLPYVPPTYALISSFQASVQDGQTVVEWSTSQERGTVGFFVERQNAAGGEWTTLNSGQMLPGLIVSAQGGDYRLVDSGALPGETYSYRLLEREVWGSTRTYGPWTITVAEAGSALASAAASEAESWKTLGHNYTARAHRIAAKLKLSGKAQTATAGAATAAENQGVRLRTGEEGLYRLDSQALSDIAAILGVNNLLQALDIGGIRMGNGDGMTPYYYDAAEQSLYFVGLAYQTQETQDNIYRMKPRMGGKMPAVSGEIPAQPAVPGVFRDTQRFEVDTDGLLLPWLHTDANADYWYWDYLMPPYIPSTVLTLQLPEPSNAGRGTLKVYLRGGGEQVAGDERKVTASINGQALPDSINWSGYAEAVLQTEFDQAALGPVVNGTAEVKLQLDAVALNGAAYDFAMIERVEVEYDRKMHAYQGGVWLRNVAPGAVGVDGFGSGKIIVIENPGSIDAKWRKDIAITEDAAGGMQVSFNAPAIADYLVTETPEAPKIEIDALSNLKAEDAAADYLIIAPRELSQGAAALSDYRKRNFNTEIVWLDDIYDEFSFGRTDSAAIEAFLDYVYQHRTHTPRYVVLLGRGTLDHRDQLGYGESLIPVRLAETPFGLAGSDNRYADVDGDHLPDMLLGRIAVSSDEDALAYVDKLIAFEAALPDAWNSRTALVADNPDSAGDFYANSDQLEARILGYAQSYTVSKLYHPLVNVPNELLSGWNDGYGYVNYDGHGSSTALASEAFLTVDGVSSLVNNDRLPVFAALTCAVGDSTMPGILGLSDALVTRVGGGAVAAFSSTGLSLDAQALPLNKYFADSLLGSRASIGDAAAFAQDTAASQDGIDSFMHDIYQISGDPAVTLR